MPIPTVSSEHPLTLHAEYLPNIRQITLYVTLPASPSQSQQFSLTISLSESRRAVTVSIAGPKSEGDNADVVSETIKLPARVHETSRRVLETTNTKPAAQNGSQSLDERRELSFRMQIDPEDALQLSTSSTDDATGNCYVPWMAGDMGPTTKARCRACGSVVLDVPACSAAGPISGDGGAGTGWVWKDLPSGNWAEMMDFWHCHKPDTHDHEKDPEGRTVSIQERNSQVRGYGAANQVVARPGTVLVDVPSFLAVEDDCKGVKKASDTSRPSAQNITCMGCESLVGVEDPIANGYRLLKAALSVSTSSQNTEESIWETHPPETVVAAQLLELVERESARRFGVHCGTENGLLLWVFNPSMYISTTSKTRTVPPHRAMKILYQEVSNITAILNPETGNLSSLSLEELQLPPGIFSALRAALQKSNSMLPGSARWFREWKVGVLGSIQPTQPTDKRGSRPCEDRDREELLPYQIVEMAPSQDPTIPDYQYFYDDDHNDDDVATWQHLEDIRPTTNSSDNSDKGTSESDDDNRPRVSHVEDISGRNVDTVYGKRSAWAAGVRVKRWFGRNRS